MQILFRLVYSLVVALLFVLFVILGTRTFYGEPQAPQYLPTYPAIPPTGALAIQCDFKSQLCYRNLAQPPASKEEARPLTLDEARKLYPEVVRQQEEEQEVTNKTQADYTTLYQRYQDDRVDYRRNVFIAASVLGVVAVSSGLYLFRRVEAMPLGLLFGGIGVVIFGWIQAVGDFDKVVTAPLFGVVAAGLVVVLAAGYRFLGSRAGPAGDGA